MEVAPNTVVSVHYKVRNETGQELESSEDGQPLVYLHGQSNIIPGVEKALEGKGPGDEVQVTVPPEEGYGARRSDLIQTVPHEAFQEIENLQPGMQLQAQNQQGQVQTITVQSVGQEGVTVDANHPLAGQTLHFDLTVDAVREATDEEIKHGHAH